MENKKLFDFQEQWEKLVNKTNENLNSLSKEERVWFTVQVLIDVVDNGGMISFFYNYGADYYKETIEDLRILNQKKIIKLLEKIGKVCFKNNIPKDIEKRNEIINSFPDDGKLNKKLERIDNEFYKLENKLEEDLVNYICINKLV